jgi:hypothetical protein
MNDGEVFFQTLSSISRRSDRRVPRRACVWRQSWLAFDARPGLGQNLIVERPQSDRVSAPALRTAAAVLGSLLFIYNINGSALLGNDTKPARYAAVSLVKRGDLDLDEFRDTLITARGVPYYLVATAGGHLMSRFDPGVPVVAAPMFAVALALGHGKIDDNRARLVGKFVGSLCVAAAAALLLLTAIQLGATLGQALVVALAYALGTGAFSIASQGLWQHGPAEFFLVLGLYLIARGAVGVSGAAFAAMAACRPADAPFAALAFGYVVVHRRRAVLAWLAWATPVAFLVAWYNLHYFGAPWRFAQNLPITGPDAPTRATWSQPMLPGLAGLLVAPSRGLLVYSPFLLFLLWAPLRTWRELDWLVRFQLVAVLALLAEMSNFFRWYGGWAFGCRMLIDAGPVLCLAIVPVMARMRRARVVWAAALGVSLAIHVVGAYCYDAYAWDAHPDVDDHRDRLWSISDSQLGYWFRHLHWRS